MFVDGMRCICIFPILLCNPPVASDPSHICCSCRQGIGCSSSETVDRRNLVKELVGLGIGRYFVRCCTGLCLTSGPRTRTCLTDERTSHAYDIETQPCISMDVPQEPAARHLQANVNVLALLNLVVPYAMLRELYADHLIVFWFFAWVVVQWPGREPVNCGRATALWTAYDSPTRPEARSIIRSIKTGFGRTLGRILFVLIIGRFIDYFYSNVLATVRVTYQSYQARRQKKQRSSEPEGTHDEAQQRLLVERQKIDQTRR